MIVAVPRTYWLVTLVGVAAMLWGALELELHWRSTSMLDDQRAVLIHERAPPPRTETTTTTRTTTAWQPLTLLALQPDSVPFSQRWPEVGFPFPQEVRQGMFDAVGSWELNSTACTSPDGRLSMAVRMSVVGFGSRVLRLVNYMLTTGQQKRYRFLFIPVSAYNAKMTTVPTEQRYNHLQSYFEQVFSMSSNYTNCDVFDTPICSADVDGKCYFNGYMQPSAEGKPLNKYTDRNYLKLSMTRDITALRRRLGDAQFLALRTEMAREMMRLRPKYKHEIDTHVSQHYSGIDHHSYAAAAKGESQQPLVFTVAMHIRRTDKLWEEAKKVHSRVFVAALLETCRRENINKLPLVLTVMSDDCRVQREFTAEFERATKKEDDAPQVLGEDDTRVGFRCETIRPDKTRLDSDMFTSFIELLVDLTIMVDADVFIGSQTSNMGVLACLLRGHHACYSVESKPATFFAWDANKDKMM